VTDLGAADIAFGEILGLRGEKSCAGEAKHEILQIHQNGPAGTRSLHQTELIKRKIPKHKEGWAKKRVREKPRIIHPLDNEARQISFEKGSSSTSTR
jgi:hypothetical protein